MMRPLKGPVESKPAPISGKRLLLILLGATVFVAALLFYAVLTGGSQHVPLSKPGIGFVTDPAVGSGVTGGANGQPASVLDAGITKTLHDRAVREALRKRILEGWAASPDPDTAEAAKRGRFLPAPTADGGTGMDPKYIQEVVRGDFMPMARSCYEELLVRKPDAGGRVEMSFTIVADEKLGGIVEDASADPDGGVADDKMTTCMRESLSTLSFRPPAHGGKITIVYPIGFSPEERDE